MTHQKTLLYCLLALAALLPSACKPDDDFVAPAFLRLEGIRLVKPQQGAISPDDGFYTADIVGAFVAAKRVGASKEDTIGCFRLPLTTPLLYDGTYEYLRIYPAVKQSGSTNAIIFYPYYRSITVDSVGVHSGDTLNLGTLTTTYESHATSLLYESFEPSEGSIKFDSTVTWVSFGPDEACTGYGYGKVSIADTTPIVRFGFDGKLKKLSAARTNILYLELDIRSDVETQVFMHASETGGDNEKTKSVMGIYPTSTWKHLYINLGRTWSEFSHNDFRISFAAINLHGQGGDVCLDNVRIVTTPVTL